LPSYDVDVPAFQRWIVGSVRPNLSNAVIQLLTEPSPQGISFIKKTPVERIEAIRESGILDEVADHMMMVSSAIYLKLGIQFDTAAAYFLSEDTVSDELLWKMRVLFAVNGLSAGVLGIETAKNPHMSHLFSAALIGMIRSPLNANLVKLLDDKDSDALRRDHGITVEIIDKAHQARLVLPTTKERADKILRPTWGSRLRRLLKGKG
jgi:hypothetical protein